MFPKPPRNLPGTSPKPPRNLPEISPKPPLKTHQSRTAAPFLKVGPMPVDKIASQTAKMREWCQFLTKKKDHRDEPSRGVRPAKQGNNEKKETNFGDKKSAETFRRLS